MTDGPVIFKDLPATFPEKDEYERRSIVSSVIFHVLLVTLLVLVPLLFPGTIQEWQLKTFLVAPLAPPPAALPPAVEIEAAAPVAPPVEMTITPEPGTLMSPVVIP